MPAGLARRMDDERQMLSVLTTNLATFRWEPHRLSARRSR